MSSAPMPALLLALLLAGTPQEAADIGELLDEAEERLVQGRYSLSEKGYEDALRAAPGHPAALLGLARLLRETGRLDEAEARLRALLGREPEHRDGRLALGTLLFRRGRSEDAGAAIEDLAKGGDLEARALRGELRLHAGRRADAEADFRFIERAAAERVVKEPRALTALGTAYHRLGRFRDSSEVLNEAADRDPEQFEALSRLARLYLDAYDDEHMDRPIHEILRLNPNYAEAHLLRARARLFRSQSGDALEALREALRWDPALEEALVLRATLALEDQDYRGAADHLETALRVNPASREARSVRAALLLLTRRSEEHRAEMEGVFRTDPTYGEGWRIVGDILAEQRRFEEARDLLEKAIERDRSNWKAWNSLGRVLFNLGEEERGVEALRTARDNERLLYKWRENMLVLAGRLREFLARDHGRFRILLHVEDHPILRGTMERVLEEAWATFTERYRFRPEGPILVEVFPAQQDFAVRTVGFEGIVGVLGACFGRVLTMNSPRALGPEGFHWVSTLWHEVAHVFTLQLSRGRVPRWLTEGISVHEEAVRHPAWAREMDLELLSAWRNGKVIPIPELNRAFRDARIVFAYFQSGLLVEHLARRFGFSKVVDLLRAYGEDLTTEEAFPKVLGRTPGEIDRSFLAAVEERVGAIRAEPAWSRESLERFREALARDPRDKEAATNLARAWFQRSNTVDAEEALAKALAADPDHPPALLLRGEMLLARGREEAAEPLLRRALAAGAEDYHIRMRLAARASAGGRLDEAEGHLRRAIEAWPRAAGKGSPLPELASLLRRKGEEEGALAIEERYTLGHAIERDVCWRLVAAALTAGDAPKALRFLEDLEGLDPFDVEVHRRRAEAFRRLGRPAEAASSLQVALEVNFLKKGPLEAEIRGHLADALLEAGDRDRARVEAEAALRKDPGQSEARAVLERLR